MAERSATDREGVGSTPTSGSHTANPGYAAFQLAKALRSAEQLPDADSRERARRRADKWVSVFTQMLDGSLQVGSRTPLENVPPWVTLEVVTGGFATGSLLAGGVLREHERALAAKLGLAVDAADRLALNRYFLSDEGVSLLLEYLSAGTYEIAVPEEGALLVTAWLIDSGHSDKARDLLDQVVPFFARLRFYPEPTKRPQRFGSRVFIQDVDATIASLRAIRPNESIATQKEGIEVWTPLYDELVGLFLETVEGPAPNLRLGPDGARLHAKTASSRSRAAGLARPFPKAGMTVQRISYDGSKCNAQSRVAAQNRAIGSPVWHNLHSSSQSVRRTRRRCPVETLGEFACSLLDT